MGKRIQRVEIEKMNTKLLELGYVGENEHTEVQIDCSGVLWDYPEATAEMTVQAPNGEKYPVVPELTDNVVVWDVTESDLVYAGSGKIQITLKNGTEVIKSASCGTRIMESIMPTGDAPTPLENWMERAEETAHQIALTAKDEVIEQIQDAAEEARESIPADYTQLSDDVTGLKSAFEQLNDNVITETAGPAPIVSIADGADGMPMRKLEVAIEPVQDLHGYDAPWPAGGGKNVLDSNIKFTAGTYYGLTLSTTDGYRYTLTGTATGSGNVLTSAVASQDAVILPAGTYYSKVGTLSLYKADGTWLKNQYSGVAFTVDEPFFVKNICIEIVSGRIYNYNDFFAIEKGQTAPTEWTPYSNICPISGWTGAKVTRTGKNLLAKPVSYFSAVPNSLDECFFLKAGTYTLSVDSFTGATSWRFGIRLKDASGNNLSAEKYNPISNIMYWNAPGSVWITGGNTNNKTLRFTLVEDCYIRIIFSLGDTSASTVANGAMLSAGSTALPYEPYQGQTYEVAFPTEAGTVYGGTLDVASGKLVVDRAKRVIDGNVSFWSYSSSYSSNETHAHMLISAPDSMMSQGQIMCDKLRLNGAKPYYKEGEGVWQGGSYSWYICVKKDLLESDDSAGFIQWLTNNNLTCIYKLATPVTYQLTPQEIKTLLGANNIWADAGNTAVTYPADTKLYIDRKITEAVANALNA